MTEQGTSTAGRKSKVKSQKSKLIYSRLFGDWIWLLYLRRDVLVKQRGLGGFPHERLLNPEGATHSVGVVTQITATLRLRSGWSGQYGLLDWLLLQAQSL